MCFLAYKLAAQRMITTLDSVEQLSHASESAAETKEKRNSHTQPNSHDQSTYDNRIPNPFNKSTSCCAVFVFFPQFSALFVAGSSFVNEFTGTETTNMFYFTDLEIVRLIIHISTFSGCYELTHTMCLFACKFLDEIYMA